VVAAITESAWARYRRTARGLLGAILPQQVRQLHDFTMVAAAPRSARSRSGNLAIFTAIRRASSFLTNFAADY